MEEKIVHLIDWLAWPLGLVTRSGQEHILQYYLYSFFYLSIFKFVIVLQLAGFGCMVVWVWLLWKYRSSKSKKINKDKFIKLWEVDMVSEAKYAEWTKSFPRDFKNLLTLNCFSLSHRI